MLLREGVSVKYHGIDTFQSLRQADITQHFAPFAIIRQIKGKLALKYKIVLVLVL